MIYECDNCEATLGPGMTVCPRCGEVFDEPVPDDAHWDGPVPAVASEGRTGPSLLKDAAALPRLRVSPRWARMAAAAFLLSGLCWLGFHFWNAPFASKPVAAPMARPPTDLAAHPQYAANMTALVGKLRGMGIGAEWPALGSNDVLVITPQSRAAEPPMAWNADMDRRLAQGIYGEFAQTRFESGFPDGDTTACFVLVISASGQVVAVDFMGKLE